MSTRQSFLLIGIQPELLDFSAPEFAAMPGLTAEKIRAGLQAEETRFAELNYDMTTLFVDLGEQAEDTTRRALEGKNYDCVVIGAGVRVPPSNFLLFEKLLNVVHQHAPTSKIAFNTRPTDTLEAVQRWL